MNGRVYDPTLGRFISADPTIQAPFLSQSLNRYSYVMNNPLSLIDPSGFSWLSKAFKSIGHFLKKWGSLIISVAFTVMGMPFIGALISSGFSTAVNHGKFGDFVKGFAIGAVAGAIAGPIAGKLSGFLGIVGDNLTEQVLRGALVGGLAGGLSSVAMGGSFLSGFVGGAITGGISAGIIGYASSTNEGSGQLQPATGGDGAPENRFVRDSSGNLVYSDEVNGPYSDCGCLRESDGYHTPRDGGTTFHGGIDAQPFALGEVVVTAKALSVTYGAVVRIGATGFGPYSVTVKTPKGNYATYGHLNSAYVQVGDSVMPGTQLGVIGFQGNVHPSGVAGTHLHFQVTTGAAFGPDSMFLGVPSP